MKRMPPGPPTNSVNENSNKQNGGNFRQNSRRDPRIKPTEAQRKLWMAIRDRQLGTGFRRNHVIGSYTADFYSAECALIIELEDKQRITPKAQAHEHHRETFMQGLGLTVLRFSNDDILKKMDSTLKKIVCVIEDKTQK